MIIGIVILVIAVVGCIVGLIGLAATANKKEERYRSKVEKLEWELAQEKAKEYEINPEQLKWYDEKVKSFENRIVELNLRIEEKKKSIEELEQEKERRLQEIEQNLEIQKQDSQQVLDNALKYSIAFVGAHQGVVNELEKQKDLLDAQKQTDEALQASKTALSSYERDIKVLENEIKDLKELKRLALLYQDKSKEGLWEFSITPKENELISILERIKMDYPELKMDISSIEWRKIWLSKAQDITNEHDLGRSGIYRLVLKSDENICYVGQAVNIKDRWYQHIKKMIGVDVKGGEKLYNYRPEDFYWSVVEFIGQGKLNEREHYWIEFFGCKEKGLNRKA